MSGFMATSDLGTNLGIFTCRLTTFFHRCNLRTESFIHLIPPHYLKVLSVIYTAADEKMVILLGMLDLSAAFDTVDHQILFYRLRYEYGLDGSVLSWFKSYLTDQTICVHYNGRTSGTVSILYGVQQGSNARSNHLHSVRGRNLQHSRKHGLGAHSYANDHQIYDDSLPSSCSSLVVRMSNCHAKRDERMENNRLKITLQRRSWFWLGFSQRLKHCPVGELHIAGVPIKPVAHARD